MTSTQAHRHARIREVFLAVCDLPDSDRTAVLDRECGDDTDLRTSVLSLLEAEREESFLVLSASAAEASETKLPERIGEFRVVGLLGRGGTAVVYEAEQQRPHRTLALKVLRSVWASPEISKRLELEGEALARLQHPGIAAVFGVGTADGSPYLAMELVDGVTLTKFATEKQLKLEERLDLFARVCDAVHHAHQRGVIHRDLKRTTFW